MASITSATISSLKKGGYAVIHDRPCRIVDISNGGQIHITGEDVFTGEREEDDKSPDSKIDVPDVTRSEMYLVDIKNGNMTLESDDSDKSVTLPSGELGRRIRRAFDQGRDLKVTVISALGEERAISFQAQD